MHNLCVCYPLMPSSHPKPNVKMLWEIFSWKPRLFYFYLQRHFSSCFRMHYDVSFWLWQMFPLLSKVIQLNKEADLWSFCKCMYLCKAGFNHLLIHPGSSTLPSKAVLILKRKEKYWSYGPNDKVICGDQLPFIWFSWKMTYKWLFHQEDKVLVVTFWHAEKIAMWLWFP